jgi:signal transduction histidine kinase
MSDIADDLLNQRRDKALRPVLLKEAVESVLSEKRQQFRSRSEINLISELDELSSVFVSVQAGELARIFSNILNNAFEAISGPGTIRVAAKKKSSTVHLEVQDSGAGLASAQLETAAAGGLSIGKLEGSGLGLSHCQTTIRSWGGDLCFFSQIGKGTRVTMVFPSL